VRLSDRGQCGWAAFYGNSTEKFVRFLPRPFSGCGRVLSAIAPITPPRILFPSKSRQIAKIPLRSILAICLPLLSRQKKTTSCRF